MFIKKPAELLRVFYFAHNIIASARSAISALESTLEDVKKKSHLRLLTQPNHRPTSGAMKKYILLFTTFVLLPSTLLAHAGHEETDKGIVSKEYLESSIAVLKGVGTYQDLDITSSLPAGAKRDLALVYTKQGIALHHAFQWEDSVRSFNEAIRLDPQMSRAHLGLITSYMSLVDGNDSLDFVGDLLQQAAQSAAKVQNNELDRLWVDALVIYYSSQLSLTVTIAPVSQLGQSLSGGVNQKLSTLLMSMINDHQDVEAYAFVGWTMQATAYLENGIQLFPRHSGLLHYLTHVYENTGRYQQAAEYAQRTITEAPDAPHLIHMYGHVLPLLGRWEEANTYFMKAHCIHKAMIYETDDMCAGLQFEAPLSSAKPSATEFWHYSHNLDLFGFSLMRTRDLEKAEQIFNERCKAGDCSTLVLFLLGEGEYERAITTAENLSQSLPAQAALFDNMQIQALVALKRPSDAMAMYQKSAPLGGLPGFATQLSLSWMHGALAPNQKATLTNVLTDATASPNFDVWSHTLPVLRNLYKIAKIYGAPEAQEIYNAIQKIDPGHPL